MNRQTELKAISEYPEQYFKVQEKTLDNRLSGIKVDEEKEIEIIKKNSKDRAKEVGRELINSVPGISQISKAAFIFMDWNKKIDSDIEDVKKEILLEKYMNRADDMEKAIDDLKEAMSDFYGNTLINKIFRMLSDYPPDGDFFNHLQTALERICKSKNFEKLFDVHKFNLSLIEKMSPQALSILADANNWPEFEFNFNGMSVGNKITDQFQFPFSVAYANEKEIVNREKIERVVYIINDLASSGFIECYRQQNDFYKLVLTNMGQTMFEYLTKSEV